MRAAVLLAAPTIAAVFLWLHLEGVPLRPHLLLSLGLGITLSLLLAGALMGLLFSSARSGHDDAVHQDEEI